MSVQAITLKVVNPGKSCSAVAAGMAQKGNGVVSKCTKQEFVKLLTLGVHPGAEGSTAKVSDFKHLIG